MPDPAGFMKVARETAAKRPVQERIKDYQHVYISLDHADTRLQASRCMDCGVPTCHSRCPVGNLIPDWNDLVYRDHWHNAIDRLHLTNNFPEFTGILCPAPCEPACVLSINDDPVNIREVELGIVERAFEEGWIVARPPEHRTGKRVAVVGSGPAGLAAAQQLNRAGHQVVIFERDDKPGGLLRYGIPDFKMEKWVLDRRLDLLREEGIEFAMNSHVGVNPTTEDLRRGFDATLLAVGSQQSQELAVYGRDLHGIHPAMTYLRQQNRRVAGEVIDPGEAISARNRKVVIIGGGDTSADCLGNAHREGAASVRVFTHGVRPPNTPDPLTWPDWPFVLRTYPSHEEGGERRWNVVITGFSGSNGHVERIHLTEVRRSPDGRLQELPGTDREVEADLILLAIGFAGPVQDRLLSDLDVPVGSNGCLLTGNDYRTPVPDVFAAGDARRGASLIVWAIAEGRQAAREIDTFLMGKSFL